MVPGVVGHVKPSTSSGIKPGDIRRTTDPIPPCSVSILGQLTSITRPRVVTSHIAMLFTRFAALAIHFVGALAAAAPYITEGNYPPSRDLPVGKRADLLSIVTDLQTKIVRASRPQLRRELTGSPTRSPKSKP